MPTARAALGVLGRTLAAPCGTWPCRWRCVLPPTGTRVISWSRGVGDVLDRTIVWPAGLVDKILRVRELVGDENAVGAPSQRVLCRGRVGRDPYWVGCRVPRCAPRRGCLKYAGPTCSLASPCARLRAMIKKRDDHRGEHVPGYVPSGGKLRARAVVGKARPCEDASR